MSFSASFLAKYKHAWAVDFDQDLVDLVNVAFDLYPYTKPLRFVPKTPVLNLLPIREAALDNGMNTQGTPSFAFQFGYLPLAAFQYLIDSKWTVSDVAVPFREMTVYISNIELARFERWNANVYRPVPVRDYDKDSNRIVVPVSIPMLLLDYLPEP